MSARRTAVRAAAAEWTRLWTVPATWWFLAAAAAIMVGFAGIAGTEAASSVDPPLGDPAWTIASFTTLPAQVALLGLALSAVSADYVTGGIVPTMQWTPRRGALFVARVVVPVATVTALAALLATASGLAGWMMASDVLVLPVDTWLDVVGDVAFVVGTGSALAAGLGFVLRNTAGGLVAVFLLVLVLPLLLPQLGYAWLTDIAGALPGSGALFVLLGEPVAPGTTELSARLTMLAWAAGLLLLGWLRLRHDDANR